MSAIKPTPEVSTMDRASARRAIEAFGWYQTIDCDGAVTPGRFDHKPFLPHYHLPESLDGQSVLDVGCSDGFFSFEMERRGAARVVAFDGNPQDGTLGYLDYTVSLREAALDKYRPAADPEIQSTREEARRLVRAEKATTFHVAKALRGSKVEHRLGSIYELDRIGETFDLVFCATVSEHLKNPMAALEQIRRVTKKSCLFAACGMLLPPENLSPGRALLARWLERIARRAGLDAMLASPHDTLLRFVGHEFHNSFFRYSIPAMRAMLEASGFDRVELVSTFELATVRGHPLRSPHAVFRCDVTGPHVQAVP